MGVRYSKKPIVYSTSVRADTSANMRADLDAILSAAAVAKASATGGFKYTLQSPDGLQMKVWVQDLGDNDEFHNYIRVTATSTDEERAGPIALLSLAQGGPFQPVGTYEAWVNCCQFFVSVFGVAGAYNFACGVLALPSAESGPCTATGSVPDITELWWSSASDDDTVHGAQNFREGRYDSGNWALSYNGALIGTTGLVLGMMPLCESFNVDYAYGSPAAIARYTSGVGFRIDALIAVASQIYGQMWDAHLYSLPETLDSTVDLTDTDSVGDSMETTWLAWNNGVPSSPPTAGTGTVLATLYLLTVLSTESLANIAY